MDSQPAHQFRVDAVWDIETAHWDEFVSGALWTPSGGVSVYREEDELAEALLALPRGAWVWAHVGGRFDVLWLLDWCRRAGRVPRAQVRMSGSTISALAITGGPIFRDSYRLVPMALKKASGMFGGVRKPELALPCRCGKNCGGFCSIARDMSPQHRDRMERYLVADVEALRDVLLGLAEFAANHQLTLRGTVASSSWASARWHCPELTPAAWDVRAYRFARKGYYGGRTEVARTSAALVWRYDRAAAYPAALREPVPCGELRLVPESRRARAVWSRGRPGIYEAVLDVPDVLAPPLPVRVAGRIAYPWGRVRGIWPRAEIANAIECGARLVDVPNALVWEKEEPILRPYVEHVWGLRAVALAEGEQGTARAAWLKWLANSLTGALAQDPEQDIFALGDKADDARWSAVGVHDWIWRRTAFRIADRAHVQYAGTLTAGARVELHRQILHAGDAWVYSDTDSCLATRELSRGIGSDLGEWKPEGAGTEWQALAPKVYRYAASDGNVVRAKGVPDASESWETLLRGGTVLNDSGVKSFLSAAKSGEQIFVRAHTRKRLRAHDEWCGARLRDGDATRAPNVADLARLPR